MMLLLIMKRFKFELVLCVLALVVVNMVVLDSAIMRQKSSSQRVLSASTSSACPSACITLINGNKTNSASREQVVPISSSGSTNSTSWYTIPGSEISFNKANYKGYKRIYFQANLSSDASDRSAYARLYDSIHGIGIQGSDISTISTTLKQLQSGEINPYSGDLTVSVQIRSLNGNTVTLTNPRISVNY